MSSLQKDMIIIKIILNGRDFNAKYSCCPENSITCFIQLEFQVKHVFTTIKT